jgi:hypothetical protein
LHSSRVATARGSGWTHPDPWATAIRRGWSSGAGCPRHDRESDWLTGAASPTSLRMRPDGPLTDVSDGLWTSAAPVRVAGLRLTSTMTVLRLRGRGLLVHSPVELTPELRAAVDALGVVEHLYAPNTYHHLSIGAWSLAFPSARVHAPAGLAKKRPDLRIDRVHGAGPEPAFASVVHELPIEGFRLAESVLYHAPTRSLIVADLVHNVGRPSHGYTAFYARAMGFYDRVALSRMIRWAAFPDRAASRRAIDALLARPIDRIVVGHGPPVVEAAEGTLRAAYTWLPARASR